MQIFHEFEHVQLVYTRLLADLLLLLIYYFYYLIISLNTNFI